MIRTNREFNVLSLVGILATFSETIWITLSIIVVGEYEFVPQCDWLKNFVKHC